ncbi:MAG TPA: class I SAM-dependent methyltransferase [Microbacteriaceae bacterium]|nr:class I SAM-dependent methyltransferase [Microbacteriaceae bacterium]
MTDHIDTNRAHWDAMARAHTVNDPFYDPAKLARGENLMSEAEQQAVDRLGPLAGKRVMHLQCHMAFDAIWFAKQGAIVTGVDLSPGSLAGAAAFASQAGVDIEWVQADAHALPEHLNGRFDVVFASIGAICWIENMQAWMDGVSRVLAPGGRLVLVDLHPILQMLGSADPLVMDWPYAFSGPWREVSSGSYTSPDAPVTDSESVSFAHDLGEVVTTCVRAGLRVDALTEVHDMPYDPRRDIATKDPDGRYRVRLAGQPNTIPMVFALEAAKP